MWDDSAEHLVAQHRDMQWIHDNVGSWLNRIFGHDEVYALDGLDRPIYASVEGRQIPADRYHVRSPELKYLVNSVRGRDPGSNGPMIATRCGPSMCGTRFERARATHDSHIILLGGVPAAASAMLVSAVDEDYVEPNGDWPVLVSVRYLDAGFLTELRSRNLIASPRFSSNGVTAPGEFRIDLRTEWNRLIGYLVWKPELPGTRIMWKLIPINLVILAGLAVFMLLSGAGCAVRFGACECRSRGCPSRFSRFPHRLAQPRFVSSEADEMAAAKPRRRFARSSWISTTSSSSTIRRPRRGRACSWRLPSACDWQCARPTWWQGSAGMNSRCFLAEAMATGTRQLLRKTRRAARRAVRI